MIIETKTKKWRIRLLFINSSEITVIYDVKIIIKIICIKFFTLAQTQISNKFSHKNQEYVGFSWIEKNRKPFHL